MRARWIVVGGAGVAAVAAFFVLKGDDAPAPAAAQAQPGTERTQPTAGSRRAPVKQRANAADPESKRTYINGQDLSDVSPSVKKWKEDGLPGTFREIVAPDDSVNEEERMTYRIRRLRFELNDAAAACYDGPDGKGAVTIDYTMVVRDGQLLAEGVAKVGSTMDDAKTEDCIVDAIKSLRAPAPDIADMRRATTAVISQHDLWRINRSAD